MLQPSMQKGPWKRPQLRSSHPLESAFSLNVRRGSVPPGQIRVGRYEQTRNALSSNLVADGIGFA
jgi:hypothetical protein